MIQEAAAQTVDSEVAVSHHMGCYHGTRWPSHLANRNYVHLASAIRLPLRIEAKVTPVHNAVPATLEQGASGCLRWALRYLRAKDFPICCTLLSHSSLFKKALLLRHHANVRQVTIPFQP